MTLTECFSTDYPLARNRFCNAARVAGAVTTTLPLSVKGPHGEDLTIDVAWCGTAKPRRVLLHSSGLHGVEGFAGSAIQIQLLQAMPAIPVDVAVVFVHALNPYGMAWLRRWNERNVDLGRNFLAECEAYEGSPAGYGALYSFLNPTRIPVLDLFRLRALWLIWKHGMPALKESVVVGQYDYPEGLFFGGQQLEEGPKLYLQFLKDHLVDAEQVAAIDVHTGLGKFGEDTLLVSESEYSRLRELFGDRVQSLSSGEENVAYPIRGGLHDMLGLLLIRSRFTFVCQEFGTYAPIRVLDALRKENCAHRHGGRRFPSPENEALKEVFCPGDDAWRTRILARGRDLFESVLKLLLKDGRL